MPFISKIDILTAYKKLSEMDKDQKQGATQRVSALRYFLALDMYYKMYGAECNTRETTSKKEFADLVGKVCGVCLDSYTTNFYFPLKNHEGDFCVGSNFYSAGQVSASLVNTQITLDYPKRGGKPLFKIRNGKLIRDTSLYHNIHNYLTAIEYRVAFVIWLIRKSNVDINSNRSLFDNIHSTLSTLFTNELIDELMVNKDEFANILDSYSLSFNDNFYSIREDDIRNMFNIQEQSAPKPNSKNISDKEGKYSQFLSAIRTKPFVLLAGISGTGKSRIVRELARACWPADDDNRKAQAPENYSMVPVKPNWHDSSELLGYKSSYPNVHYVAGDFLKFVVKAWTLTSEFGNRTHDMPCFLCLDEMNLAPVEQYFAEYLSCIESRDNKSGRIVTDPLVKPIKDKAEQSVPDDLKNIVKGHIEDNSWYSQLLVELLREASCPNETFYALYHKFMEEGISIPSNLVVMGTVNMDETTFAFSRKVLDRAMTIEMNEVNLRGGLGEAPDKMPDLSDPSKLPILGERIKAEDIYMEGEGNPEEVAILNKVLYWLQAINDVLDRTPFKIAYRTRNEIVLYVINSVELGKNQLVAFDEAVNMKILPRIEGDAKKVGDVLDRLKATISDFYKSILPSEDSATTADSEAATEDNANTSKSSQYSPSLNKLDEMSARMANQFYCTYWS